MLKMEGKAEGKGSVDEWCCTFMGFVAIEGGIERALAVQAIIHTYIRPYLKGTGPSQPLAVPCFCDSIVVWCKYTMSKADRW
jgi:hypothetical protein